MSLRTHETFAAMSGTDKLYDTFMLVHRHYLSRLVKVLAGHSIFRDQHEILELLALFPKGLTMGEIGQHTSRTQASMTGIVDRLITLHLVDRQTSTRDRRYIYITITGRGRDVVERVRDEMSGVLAELTGCLSPAEQRAFGALHEKLFGALTQ